MVMEQVDIHVHPPQYPNQKTPHRCYKFHKNYLKMDHDSPNIKHKTIKLLYQNTGENLGDHGFGDESRYNPKAQFIEEKTGAVQH